MFSQLFFYVRAARKRGEAVPAFLAVIDREKAAIMLTEHALPLFDDRTIDWPKSGSGAGRQLAAKVAPYVQAHIVEYEIAFDETTFIKAVKDAIREQRIIRTPITPDNLRQVFDRWVDLIGSELGVGSPTDYAVLFFADIMHDGLHEAMNNLPARLLFNGTRPVFLLNGQTYELSNERGYKNFWAIYHRPPEQTYRHYLLERRDSLLPMDEQKFKGAFYTPIHIVDKAYDHLRSTLGNDWQRKYIVWDMCAGVGNLEAKHSNLRNVFMSTIDSADVTIMRSNPAFSGAEIFQYDYLNDDINEFGQIDYEMTKKVPVALRQAIHDAASGADDAKRILVLINPPYAEAMNVDNMKDGGMNAAMKKGVANTRIGANMDGLGYAARELFVQFLCRITAELPSANLAMFSTLKYVNAPNFKEFRRRWTAQYLAGFIVHSMAFDGLKGDFPIGFLIWNLAVDAPSQRIDTIALSRSGEIVAEKAFFREEPREYLADWIQRPRPNSHPALPLKNALSPTSSTKDVRGKLWANNAIGSMIVFGNDVQHASQTSLLSSGYGNAGAFFVTKDNIKQAAVVFAVRRLVRPGWMNDRDQFMQAAEQLSSEFELDCLMWMLFSNSNLSAAADGIVWNGRNWSLTNHFIPFSEAEVGAKGRFESNFMNEYISNRSMSKDANSVLCYGCTLWERYHAISMPAKIRSKWKLGRPDVGWYQIRNALTDYNEIDYTDFSPLKAAYAELTAKLRPEIYRLGFLPE